jgi:predicted ribosome quality control (RQC) complex YloA/Tae2 family protein
MIQYYLDLEKQVKAVNDRGLAYGQIQKIYSTAFYVSFSIRSPGKTWHIYLGRGAGQEGVWLGEEPPPSVLRRKDNFLEYLRRHLSSCSFVALSLDKFDRIVKLDYQKFGQLQSILFFWRARKLYFLHHFQDQPEGPFKLLLSWRGKAVQPSLDQPDLFDYFNDVGRRTDMKHDFMTKDFPTIDQLLAEEKKAAQLKEVTSGPTFLQRKIANIEQDLERTRQWNKLQELLDRGNELQMYELKVGDHKIKFEGDLNAFERRNLLYEKIKKLKRGESILSQRLQETQDLLSGKKQEPKSVATIPITKPVWGREEATSKETSKQPEREDYRIFPFDGFSVGVGTTSRGNDQLRNAWATKEDTWVHLDGLKSAHAVIKLHQKSFDPQMLNLAASIVAYFSHFNDEWIPIIYTAVKNLKGVSGSAGMVIYKKEKHLRCLRVESQIWLKE